MDQKRIQRDIYTHTHAHTLGCRGFSLSEVRDYDSHTHILTDKDVSGVTCRSQETGREAVSGGWSTKLDQLDSLTWGPFTQALRFMLPAAGRGGRGYRGVPVVWLISYWKQSPKRDP